MDKQSRIFFKMLGLILLLLLTVKSLHPDFPNYAAASLGAASGMLFMFLFEEFK